jgi:hypothetical protein
LIDSSNYSAVAVAAGKYLLVIELIVPLANCYDIETNLEQLHCRYAFVEKNAAAVAAIFDCDEAKEADYTFDF